MLLCIDIGNTNITLGVYQADQLAAHWRVNTDHHKMPDEYGILLVNLMEHLGLDTGQIDGVVIASVVPPVTDILAEVSHDYFQQQPLIVGSGIKTGVSIRYDNPHEVGADRVVNAAAAYRLYGGPACIVDFGTATTFDALSNDGAYLGGAIAPGIRISAEALFARTAKLPRIDLQAPERTIGRNTSDSMRSGILYGYVGLVEGMVDRFIEELGPETIVIATGGLASFIARETDVFDHIDKWLTLKGLRIIYLLNRGEG
jgi:type III pantothenate kinase